MGDAWTPAGMKRRRRRAEGGAPAVPGAPVTTTNPSPLPENPTPVQPGPGPVRPPMAPPPPVTTAPPVYGVVSQALLPYLSPEDASALSTYYGLKNPGGKPVSEITTGIRSNYLSADRASNALRAITNALSAANVTTGGPGVAFLQNVISLLGKYGGTAGNGMSREAYGQFKTDVDLLFKQAEGNSEIGQFASLASMFTNPTFAAGEIYNNKASKRLYR